MIRIAADPESLARLAASTVALRLHRALELRDRCTFALAGGETPRPCYRLLAADHRNDVRWRDVHLFLGDERMVPAGHPDSNLGMVQRELVGRLQPTEIDLHGVPTEFENADRAAERYHDDIRWFFDLETHQYPRFDLVLLGLGEDGHTASLFPGCRALGQTTKFAAACDSRHLEHARVTLTLRVINAAASVLFLVSGENKAEALRRVLEMTSESDLPAARVAPVAGELLWLVDEAAASRLSRQMVREAP